MTTYNGWTNYETWRVNLEVIDSATDFWVEALEYYQDEGGCDINEAINMLASAMQENTEEFAFEGIEDNIIAESAVATYLNNVNWLEIAKHIADLVEA